MDYLKHRGVYVFGLRITQSLSNMGKCVYLSEVPNFLQIQVKDRDASWLSYEFTRKRMNFTFNNIQIRNFKGDVNNYSSFTTTLFTRV